MPLVGFEPTISATERPKTHALDRAATGIGAVLNDGFQVINTTSVSGTPFRQFTNPIKM
jgi:hypothetical protein